MQSAQRGNTGVSGLSAYLGSAYLLYGSFNSRAPLSAWRNQRRASVRALCAYEAGSEYGLVEPQRERTYRLYVLSRSYFVLEVALPAIRICAFHSRLQLVFIQLVVVVHVISYLGFCVWCLCSMSIMAAP
jgi:hypothetical protein